MFLNSAQSRHAESGLKSESGICLAIGSSSLENGMKINIFLSKILAMPFAFVLEVNQLTLLSKLAWAP